MSYLRKDKIKRPPKEISGDHKTKVEEVSDRVGAPDPLADLSDDERIERGDELSNLISLEMTEAEIDRLFFRARAKLKDIKIDVQSPSVLASLTVLNDGVPTNELDLKLIQRALDLHLDSFTHTQGFDPIPAIMRCHEDPAKIKMDQIPEVPLPHPLYNGPFGINDREKIKPMNCSEMQKLSNIPDPEVVDENGNTVQNSDYETAPLNVVIDKVKRFTLLDLLSKLAALFVYFIAKFIRDFVHPYRNKRFIKGLIRGIIRKMEKVMKKAWCKITEECSEDERYPAEELEDMIIPDDIEYTDLIDETVFENKGSACIEAAAVVMKHIDETQRANKDLYALFKAEEMAQYHEAQKHGYLMAVTDRDEFSEKIEKLNKSTKDKPRFNKRYGICREHFKKRLDKAGIFNLDDNS